jgi:hypothetical protein
MISFTVSIKYLPIHKNGTGYCAIFSSFIIFHLVQFGLSNVINLQVTVFFKKQETLIPKYSFLIVHNCIHYNLVSLISSSSALGCKRFSLSKGCENSAIFLRTRTTTATAIMIQKVPATTEATTMVIIFCLLISSTW